MAGVIKTDYKIFLLFILLFFKRLHTIFKYFVKKSYKIFCTIEKMIYLCTGLSNEVLSPINLLVISFSVINYVVRVRVHAGSVDTHFFMPFSVSC